MAEILNINDREQTPYPGSSENRINIKKNPTPRYTIFRLQIMKDRENPERSQRKRIPYL